MRVAVLVALLECQPVAGLEHLDDGVVGNGGQGGSRGQDALSGRRIGDLCGKKDDLGAKPDGEVGNKARRGFRDKAPGEQ